MSERFEESLVFHCAPTLAGHKCGSLFSYHYAPGEARISGDELRDAVLAHKGLLICLLKDCCDGCLVYVYRPSMLALRLSDGEIAGFLAAYGYTAADGIEAALAHLAARIHCGESFPHEIGIFLDYPLADVIGFIENSGRDYCCTGCWKAYSNADDASRRFALYKKCRDVYLQCYRRGFAVSRLTIAA